MNLLPSREEGEYFTSKLPHIFTNGVSSKNRKFDRI